MNDSSDGERWLGYARENLQLAELALGAGLLNPSLQNSQQAIEKALKAMRVGSGLPLVRTHRISDLNRGLETLQIDTGLSITDCELMDSIFVTSKYPPESALPNSLPEPAVCQDCIQIAKRVLERSRRFIENTNES